MGAGGPRTVPGEGRNALISRPTRRPDVSVPAPHVRTAAYGLGAAGLLNGGAVRRYLVFVCLARYDKLLPLRLGLFLDWALEAGLLRLAGPAYQFRHRELQQWLATHPKPTAS
jgi:hypothetical protein